MASKAGSETQDGSGALKGVNSGLGNFAAMLLKNDPTAASATISKAPVLFTEQTTPEPKLQDASATEKRQPNGNNRTRDVLEALQT